MMRYIVKPKDIVCEIGVFQGKFAEFLFSLTPELLVLIDPFQGIVFSGDQDGNNGVHCNLDAVYEYLKERYRPVKSIQLIRGFSYDILPKFEDKKFNVIYIDGDHSYEGVKRDLNIALKKIKPGGYICGHDYEMNMTKAHHVYDFGVKRAVDEFCEENRLHICAKGLDGCVSFAIQVPF